MNDDDPVRPGEAEFESFYSRNLVGQVRRASLLTGSSDIAEDVVHDAMVEIYRRWDSLQSPDAYLSRVVLNGCRDAGRGHAARRRLSERLVPRDTAAPTGEILDDVLESLPFNQRAAVVLRFYVGMSMAEIATAMGCAPGSVGPWIDRALKKMRRALS